MGPLDGLDDVEWRSLSIAGSDASYVPEMLRLFASPVPGEVEAGWELLSEEGLSHQGTVYPGTAAAIRFIGALAASERVLRRARLIELLAFLSLRDDQPYAPAGTARHVRDAVRLCAIDLHPVLATDDVAVQLALAELAAAMPVEMSPAHDVVQRLCASAMDSRVTALAAAACLLGDDTPARLDILRRAQQEYTYNAVTIPLPDGTWLIEIPAKTGSENQRSYRPIATIPVHDQMTAWIDAGRPHTEDEAYLDLLTNVQWLFLSENIIQRVIYDAP
jgi:hypothetical protein